MALRLHSAMISGVGGNMMLLEVDGEGEGEMKGALSVAIVGP